MKVVSAEFLTSAAEPSRYPDDVFPEVAFAGRSNVGKSSLINTITGRKALARTSGTPGCTRLINFFRVNRQITFVDLPGYGFAKVPLSVRRQWGPMVETYLRERKSLRLVVVILDIRRDPSGEDIVLTDWLHHYNVNFIFVLTKIDKISRNQQRMRQRHIKELLGLTVDPVLFSARTGEGKNDVWKAIRNGVVLNPT
ncbi:MAG: YihA family ribosome biogenesis GTP-binding protein [Deltaproteobacteria bacterium]|nr:YihA family ribosome biogenesis GTP-binding protein [Deltaproteobacteria bacterium]